MKFRKKPVTIEAVQFTGNNDSEIEAFMGKLDDYWKDHHVGIQTLEGRMEASPGDWIIKGVQGEFYPCKDEIFQKTYEKV